MSNIFITEIVGTNDYAVPTDDTELATATSGLDTLLSGVSNLTYDRVLAWVEDSGGPDGAEGTRSLNCLVEKITYLSNECPSESQVDTMISDIESALEADTDITSVGNQQVHIFQAGAYTLWSRDATGGFVYPTTTTDDIAVGGLTPDGKWFDDGDLVLGAAAMSGTEKLRVVGSVRVDTNGQLLIADSATIPPLNITERSSEPSSPAAGDIYVDDGTNTASGSPGWRRYTGSAWEDMGALSGGGGSSPWTQDTGFIYLTTTTDSVVIGDTALTGSETLKVDGGDILLEGGNVNIPDTVSADVGVYEIGGSPFLHNYGDSAVHIGGGGNFIATDFVNVITIGSNALASATGTFQQVIAIGHDALTSHSTGLQNMICIGYKAGESLTTAQTDVVIGNEAMQNGTTCRECVVIGQQAYQDGTSNENVIIGYQAALQATNANRSVVIGAEASAAVMTATANIILGYNSARDVTSASNSVIIGFEAAQTLTTGSQNVAIGSESLNVNNSGTHNVSIGYRAMADVTTIASGALSNNVAIGSEALRLVEAGSNHNVAIGYHAMYDVDGSGTVLNNVAVGSRAGDGANSADACVYLGYQAGVNNTTSNRLIIENSSDITTPLIDGDFSGQVVRINDRLKVNTSEDGSPLTAYVVVEDDLATADRAGVSVVHTKSATGTSKTHYGFVSEASLEAAATVDSYRNFEGKIEIDDASGSILGATGINLICNPLNGTITSYIGVAIENQGTSTVTNAYGILIHDMGASSGSYGIWQDSANDSNYFNGRVGVNNQFVSSTDYLNVTDDDETGARRCVTANIEKNSSGGKGNTTGFHSELSHTGSGTGATYNAFASVAVVNNSSAVVGSVFGFRSNLSVSAGTVDLYYALYADASDAGGTITASYGLRIKKMEGTTTSYGVYQEDSADDNYFAGNMGLGDNSPSYQLDVNGDINVQAGNVYRYNGTQILTSRQLGWTAATGTATRSTFNTATVTLSQLAERVKALIDDLGATAGHGLINA